MLVGVVVAVHPLVRTCVPFVPLLASCGRLCRKLRGPSVRCDAVQHLLCKPAFRHARCECDPHLLALTVSTCPMHVYSVVVSCRAGNGASVCVCVCVVCCTAGLWVAMCSASFCGRLSATWGGSNVCFNFWSMLLIDAADVSCLHAWFF